MSQVLISESATVAVFRTHDAAEDAIRHLQRAGFDLTKLSIIGKDYRTEETVTGYYSTSDRMKKWGALGAFWGGVWGLLYGSAFFFIPAIGPVLVAGPLVAMLVTGLESAVFVGGLSIVGAALVSLGIPKHSVLAYETALKGGRFIVVAHGTDAQAARAREILERTAAESTAQHAA